MSHLSEMYEAYKRAGESYDNANRASNEVAKASWQEQGDKEYAKAYEAAEKEKQEISQKACQKAEGFYDKQAEAYAKGDYKEAKKYQQLGDKEMENARLKEKAVEQEQKRLESEVRSKTEGLEKRRY